ncbi:MAG: beta-lactamase [Chitinophagaceae bacterium]|nr:beta-lactamase [Chitinophagaceae bacterium]
MKKNIVLLIILLFYFSLINAQYKTRLARSQWIDSVFRSLGQDEKIAQLMVLRTTELIDRKTLKIAFYDSAVGEAIQKYNIGAICLFQGGATWQANMLNRLQGLAKTPLMVCIDAEYGLGMRILDSIIRYPYQLTLGALQDPKIVYQYGVGVAKQLRRMNIHVNYAPDVDINNNPNNPVIGYRSFGEDKYKVAAYGIQYMKALQDNKVMACAKHFPGHGDVAVDSHFDLPVISKTKTQLDSLELYPFRQLFNAGVGSVMIAHLFIPAIDSEANRASSVSYNTITKLMRDEIGYKGLTFTDALEMKGVSKNFPDGEASVQSLIAGNDMLCLPGDIEKTFAKIKDAIAEKKLTWDNIDNKVKKVLAAKYDYVIGNIQPVNTTNLVNDLNKDADRITGLVAKNVITILRNENHALLKLKKQIRDKILYVGVGLTEENIIAKRLKDEYHADFIPVDGKTVISQTDIDSWVKNYSIILVGVHAYPNSPVNNFNLSPSQSQLLQVMQQYDHTASLYFGNPYAMANSCQAKNLVAFYQDDSLFQEAAIGFLEGSIPAKGRLPVTVCNDLKFGAGIFQQTTAVTAALHYRKLQVIDSIANDAIARKAFPGCVVLAAKDGELIYHKSFGHDEYESSPAVSFESIYDLASVTKTSATTLAVMKLYEEGKLGLDKTLGDYLSWTKGSNKEHLKIRDILLHQAGLVPFITFYRETLDTATGIPNPAIYSEISKPGFTVRVAENLYMRNDWDDTIFQRILKSPVNPSPKYVYSDNDFIFLGKVIEAISGMTLDQYVQKTFYNKMGLTTTGFKPRNRFPVEQLVPTENEKDHFRRQQIQGDVHDEGASMFGGVSGHAGLFSDAYDLAMLYQMLLNGGAFNGESYLSPETIKYFTAYHSDISRRGYGFDKPEKDDAAGKEPYPAASASAQTFGHTGFTGTCVWVDPESKLVFVFLSNRVYPTRNNSILSDLNIRPKILEAIYQATADVK